MTKLLMTFLKGCITSWLVLGMFLYAVTMVLKRRSTLFTLHMAYMADIINCKNNEKQFEKKRTHEERNGERTREESSILSGYLVEMAVSHQLILVLQSVLEECPYDGLQFRVGGQQVGAEHLQPCIGQAVHYREKTIETVGHREKQQ